MLPRVDPILENNEEPINLDILWVSNLVDILNNALQDIEESIASIDARLTAGGL